MRPFLGLLIALTIMPATALARTPSPATSLLAIAQQAADQNGFSGTVLVVADGKILLDRGFGQASREWHVPNMPDAHYRIGSLTKQFTAALVLQLRDEGRVDLKASVRHYLPSAPTSWEKVSVRDLLAHRSGIPNFTGMEGFDIWAMQPHQPAALLDFFREAPLDFDPGTRFEYSNSNYIVLGLLLEHVTGRHYAELLDERLLGPLGLSDSGLDRDDLVLPRRAVGYQWRNGALAPARGGSISVPWSAGGMYSTTHDLWKWERALFDGRVVSSASLRDMTTPGLGDYGLGLAISTFQGHRLFDHEGRIEEFSAYLGYLPDWKMTVVILSNISDTPGGVLAHRLLAGYGRELTVPRGKAQAADSSGASSP